MPRLSMMPGRFTICRLPAADAVPAWADSSPFASVTRTPDELSIVCDEANVPHEVKAETGWRILKVEGPLDFSAVGIVASLTVPVAAAGISIFVISTFDTDYLLVKVDDLAGAADALRGAGHTLDMKAGNA